MERPILLCAGSLVLCHNIYTTFTSLLVTQISASARAAFSFPPYLIPFLPACLLVKVKHLRAGRCKAGPSYLSQERHSEATTGTVLRQDGQGAKGRGQPSTLPMTFCGVTGPHRERGQEALSPVPGTIKTNSRHDNKATYQEKHEEISQEQQAVFSSK